MFLTENVVSIVAGTPTNYTYNLVKHINIPKTTKYMIFKKGNVKNLINVVDGNNQSLEKKRIKKYPKLKNDLMIQIQHWIMKDQIIMALLITNETLLVKDELQVRIFFYL